MAMKTDQYEKLGQFYLGKISGTEKDEIVLYDSKDLTTHAVCVGMTGSGKTGLCISLLEEAAIDGIPSIIIDPKGDMGNLLLSFPDLSAESFLPWINQDEARKKGLSAPEYAQEQAELWKNGLAKWGQDGSRIQKLRQSAEFCVYTPGSTAGTPVSILDSFAAPPQEILDQPDLFAEQVSTTMTSLLDFLDIDSDPVKSKEHILLSNILTHFWKQKIDLDISTLIQSIQSPPISKIGVFDLDTFYPAGNRMELAMTVNNLLAAPGFQTWLQGEPMNIGNFYYTDSGKPKVSIFYIAHLSETERMFFVSLLLNQLIGWMRRQPGTTSLRSLLYFDEIFGYMPPVSNPPSKKPLLTLLKQARAFGVGLVLATQNPVDLDYKGLSNTGTWFIGRLQTERDRDRVLDGLQGTGENLERKEFENLLSALGQRIFLLHNVHENRPFLFNTRWVLSYLRGPLTRTQIKDLSQKPQPQGPTDKPDTQQGIIEPVLDARIKRFYMPVRSIQPQGSTLCYQRWLWGRADIRFLDQKKKIDIQETIRLITPLQNDALVVDWMASTPVDMDEDELEKKWQSSPHFTAVPAAATKASSYAEWKDQFEDYIYKSHKLELFKSPAFDVTSKPGESEKDFRIRLAQIAREQRDQWVEKLREKYAAKIDTVEAKIQTAAHRVEKEKAQARHQKLNTAISVGATLLGAFLGGKKMSRTNINKVAATIRRAGRTAKESSDVEHAEQKMTVLQQKLQELEQQLEQDIKEYEEKYNVLTEKFDRVALHLKKQNITVKFFGFVWKPVWQ